MKKIIIILVISFFNLIVTAQSFTIAKLKVGEIELSIDSSSYGKYMFCHYQNDKYSYISDICSIMIKDSLTLSKFIKDLRRIIESSIDIRISNGYTLAKNGNVMYLSNDENKFILLKKRQIEKLIPVLETYFRYLK